MPASSYINTTNNQNIVSPGLRVSHRIPQGIKTTKPSIQGVWGGRRSQGVGKGVVWAPKCPLRGGFMGGDPSRFPVSWNGRDPKPKVIGAGDFGTS